MCVVCGCAQTGQQQGDAAATQVAASVNPNNGDLHFGKGAARVSVPGMSPSRAIQLEADILGANNQVAAHNRAHFLAHGVTALNLVSSPGSGKTTLLCATIEALKKQATPWPVAVIEGDQQTSFDADRIRATGAPAIQVNTGKGCHLDAPMVAQAFASLHSHQSHDHDHDHHHVHDHGHNHQHHHHHHHDTERSLLFIENVGNLVCPAVWDLGEAAKVAILSVTEGEDKPLKYPDMFAAAALMVINKIDLLPHVRFDVARCIELARRVNPQIEIIQLSATTGEGMDDWLHWIALRVAPHEHAHSHADKDAHAHDAALHQRVAELEAALAQARAALSAQ